MSVKCKLCNNTTTNHSGLCDLHEGMFLVKADQAPRNASPTQSGAQRSGMSVTEIVRAIDPKSFPLYRYSDLSKRFGSVRTLPVTAQMEAAGVREVVVNDRGEAVVNVVTVLDCHNGAYAGFYGEDYWETTDEFMSVSATAGYAVGAYAELQNGIYTLTLPEGKQCDYEFQSVAVKDGQTQLIGYNSISSSSWCATILSKWDGGNREFDEYHQIGNDVLRVNQLRPVFGDDFDDEPEHEAPSASSVETFIPNLLTPDADRVPLDIPLGVIDDDMVFIIEVRADGIAFTSKNIGERVILVPWEGKSGVWMIDLDFPLANGSIDRIGSLTIDIKSFGAGDVGLTISGENVPHRDIIIEEGTGNVISTGSWVGHPGDDRETGSPILSVVQAGMETSAAPDEVDPDSAEGRTAEFMNALEDLGDEVFKGSDEVVSNPDYDIDLFPDRFSVEYRLEEEYDPDGEPWKSISITGTKENLKRAAEYLYQREEDYMPVRGGFAKAAGITPEEQARAEKRMAAREEADED